jgi:hypothetical protein
VPRVDRRSLVHELTTNRICSEPRRDHRQRLTLECDRQVKNLPAMITDANSDERYLA